MKITIEDGLTKYDIDIERGDNEDLHITVLLDEQQLFEGDIPEIPYKGEKK